MKNLSAKDTKLDRKTTIRVKGQLMDLSEPKILGILNLTPDSFYDGGTLHSIDDALRRVDLMLEEGADGIDIGAQSTRPNADQISPEEEWNRLEETIIKIRQQFPHTLLSLDTYHASVARKSVEQGIDMINDISGGTFDPEMYATIAELKVPYVLMHIQGSIDTMQDNPVYEDVVLEVTEWLAKKAKLAVDAGIDDLLIDPGFGFGKTIEHNYDLLKNLDHLNLVGHPLFIGLSRKSMIWKVLKNSPDEALNGTTALHMVALRSNPGFLRVHDVKAAVETRTLWQQLNSKLAEKP